MICPHCNGTGEIQLEVTIATDEVVPYFKVGPYRVERKDYGMMDDAGVKVWRELFGVTVAEKTFTAFALSGDGEATKRLEAAMRALEKIRNQLLKELDHAKKQS